MSELILKAAMFCFNWEIEGKERERERKKERKRPANSCSLRKRKYCFCGMSKGMTNFINKASNLWEMGISDFS